MRKFFTVTLVAIGILIGIGVGRCFPTSPARTSPDFDSIYEIVLSHAVHTDQSGLFSVVLARDARNDDSFTFAPLPARLQHRLITDWSHNGVHLDLLIPSERIHAIVKRIEHDGRQIPVFERYVDATTQKTVTVYLIDSVCWLGSDEVLVSWSGTEANLSARGSKIKLKFESGFWHIVQETDGWVS